MLPTHTKGSAVRVNRGPQCSSEMQLLLIVFVAFCVVSFGALFFVPELAQSLDSSSKTTHSHGHVGVRVEYENGHVHDGRAHDHGEKERSVQDAGAAEGGEEEGDAAVDELKEKVEQLKRENEAMINSIHKKPPKKRRVVRPRKDDEDVQVEVEEGAGKNAAPAPGAKHGDPTPIQRPVPGSIPNVHGNIESSPYETDLVKQRREHVKSMMKRAWDGYAAHAMGQNELMPISQRGHSASIFGSTRMGATVVDALDTLHIMGLTEEFKVARDWVASELSFDHNTGVSVFEICIRFVGGLLSAYAMTGDEMFKAKAYDIGKRLLPAFDSPTGIPRAMVNLQNGQSNNWGWASGGCSILSEFGTMQMEFEYLSHITGDKVFKEKVEKVMNYVINKPKPSNGMFANYLHPDSGNWGSAEVSVGALGDSFYEYLLKYWIMKGDYHAKNLASRKVFDDTMQVLRQKLMFRSQPSNLLYFAEGRGDGVQHKMGHLACFIGGLLGLGARGAPADLQAWYTESGIGIANTCHEGYRRTATGIGPEAMYFEGGQEAKCNRGDERYYILRPEVVETYFVMWRMTHDNKYRDWAWEAIESIEKHCRCGVAYCGLRDVEQNPAQQDDVQQSFFLAETMKYLYLIFTDDDTISLDKWVFNTEAHPLPVIPQL